MDSWQNHSGLAQFANINTVFELQGERVDRSPISEIFRICFDEKIYYVKRYHRAGKHLRRFIGRSRIRGEWENLLLFKGLGIPAAEPVAYGEVRDWGLFQCGALVMPELENTLDLAEMARQQHPLLSNGRWVAKLSQQLAVDVACMHRFGFVHVDLKWRNILIDVAAPDSQPRYYFIDCPSGQKQFGFLLRRGIVKDLACLDKWAKQVLTAKQRLYFFKCYLGVTKLDGKHRRMAAKILQFFKGRE